MGSVLARPALAARLLQYLTPRETADPMRINRRALGVFSPHKASMAFANSRVRFQPTERARAQDLSALAWSQLWHSCVDAAEAENFDIGAFRRTCEFFVQEYKTYDPCPPVKALSAVQRIWLHAVAQQESDGNVFVRFAETDADWSMPRTPIAALAMAACWHDGFSEDISSLFTVAGVFVSSDGRLALMLSEACWDNDGAGGRYCRFAGFVGHELRTVVRLSRNTLSVPIWNTTRSGRLSWSDWMEAKCGRLILNKISSPWERVIQEDTMAQSFDLPLLDLIEFEHRFYDD